MPEFSQEYLIQMMITAPPLLLSLTLHEYAHARVALAFGDTTARDNGRVTLNPLAHLDFMGTMMLLFSGIMGWAKPVPVNPNNLYPRRLGDIMVSAAGPLTNLVLAIIVSLALRGWHFLGPRDAASYEIVWTVLYFTARANLCLCFFNLLPLFPLDGHHIVRELLPPHKQRDFMQWQVRFGGLILIGLIIVPRMVGGMVSPLRVYFDTVAMPLLNLLAF